MVGARARGTQHIGLCGKKQLRRVIMPELNNTEMVHALAQFSM